MRRASSIAPFPPRIHVVLRASHLIGTLGRLSSQQAIPEGLDLAADRGGGIEPVQGPIATALLQQPSEQAVQLVAIPAPLRISLSWREAVAADQIAVAARIVHLEIPGP